MKTSSTGFDVNWYKLWMKQSQEFFDSANKHLRDMFIKEKLANPADHIEMINAWLDSMKQHWSAYQKQKESEHYWELMQKIYSDAADLMLSQWMKRTREEHPIKNIHELYDLWLDCCHQMYQKKIKTKSYQEAYADFMDKALKFWESTTKR